MANSNKTPWHLWLIALFFIFIYANGVYDYFMMLGHNQDYYNSKNYGEAVYKYFTNYPVVLLFLWAINIFGSMIASVALVSHSVDSLDGLNLSYFYVVFRGNNFCL